MNKTISCVIRTYNESNHIGKLINTLHSQERTSSDLEIIVVDSGSSDSTVEISKRHGAHIIEIPKAEFNYSKSLNLGIKNSTGDLIVILSGHSIPCNSDWLYKMTAHFGDGKVAGLYCRQIPHSNADPMEVLRIKNTFGPNSKEFHRDTSTKDMHFSNAASCIRRSVWEKHPFIHIPAAEDQEWAQRAIETGHKIIYDAEVFVRHSHRDTCRQAARRMIELEKTADVRFCRKRNLFLTIKQAARWFIQGLAIVYSSEHFKGSRARQSVKCLLRSFRYIVDFHR